MAEPAWRRELNRLFASVKDDQEAEALLGELLTPAEYAEFARRWQIIKLLMQKKTQRVIQNELSVSIATVTRGSRALQQGHGAFEKFYKRLYK
ncbi:MAG: Trp family transcriptional regulator [Deltaproteobacteria bacterium]|nr:Trp family transcriptional regulator [Deltaproteobacteria bacterium]